MLKNVTYAVKSDIGLLRHNNEDSFLVVDQSSDQYEWQRLGLLFVVADGLGGHAAGEIASKMACEEIVAAYYAPKGIISYQVDNTEGKMHRLEQAVWSAHKKIIRRASQDPKLFGMGTTLSALVLADEQAHIAHVGDSRIYRLRNNFCERMTLDHIKNQLPFDQMEIPPEWEGKNFYHRVLTQALGGYDDLSTIFTRVAPVQAGDVFLLCTDGLHDLLTDTEIREILVKKPLPSEACGALVQAALSKGGHDNVTAMVICL